MDYAVLWKERQGFLEKSKIGFFGQGLVVAGFVHGGQAGVLQDVEGGDFQAEIRYKCGFDRLNHRTIMTILFCYKLYGSQHVFFAFTGEAENQMGYYVDGRPCFADTADGIYIILIGVAAVYEATGLLVTGTKSDESLDQQLKTEFTGDGHIYEIVGAVLIVAGIALRGGTQMLLKRVRC